MPNYKLRYFHSYRGRIHHIRLMLAEAGVDYEIDHVMKEDWPQVKSEQPFEQLPVLFVDGKDLSQTQTIARYLAHQLGFAGENDWESALCDMYVDGYHDMYNSMIPTYYKIIYDNDREAATKSFDKVYETKVKPFLERYEKFLLKNGGEWFVGKKPTWADFAIAEIVNRFMVSFRPTLLNEYPTLKNHKERVFELPGVKKYMATAPEFIF